MEGKSIITPLSADEVIAELGKKDRAKRLSKNIRIMIRILSEKMLSGDELLEQLRNEPDYDFREADGEKVKHRLATLRYHKILVRQDRWYFIKGTIADPEIQDCVSGRIGLSFSRQKRKAGEIRSLKSIIYEILQKEPLSLNRLAMRVKNHPDYDDLYGQGKELVQAISHALNERRNRKFFFERESGQKRFFVWRVKAGSSPPLRGFHQKARPRRDNLYQIMRSKSVIKGWSLLDLYEEVIKPDSGYKVKPSSSAHSVVVVFQRILANNEGEYFERILTNGKDMRWRAKWVGQLKIPSAPQDFKDLVMEILNDLMFPVNMDNLLKVIRQYGHLFGYIANELPLPFLRNSILRAVAGTEYAKKIQG